MPPLLTRKAAVAAGLHSYFTGKPCHLGHLAERSTRDRACRECDKLADRRRYAKHAAVMNAYHKQRRERQPDEVRARDRAAYQAARASRLAKAALYRSRNPEKTKASAEKWRAANLDKRAASQRNRKARAKAAGRHSAADVAEIKSMQRSRCAYCRIKLGNRYHVDHIIALSNGGSNQRRNLQILCQPCNQTKHAKDPIVFAQQLGRLI